MTNSSTAQTDEQPQGLTWLFSSTSACIGLLLLALGLLQVSVIRAYESDYFIFYRDLVEAFFEYGVQSVEGWFIFLAIFGPIVATVVVVLGPAMTSKARASVIFLGAFSTWGWVAYYLADLEWFEGTNWFEVGLRSTFLSETDPWGSVGNWILIALLVLSVAHILTPPPATSPASDSAADIAMPTWASWPASNTAAVILEETPVRAAPLSTGNVITTLAVETEVFVSGDEKVSGGITWWPVITPDGTEGWIDVTMLRDQP